MLEYAFFFYDSFALGAQVFPQNVFANFPG